jgi:hypothetical protein
VLWALTNICLWISGDAYKGVRILQLPVISLALISLAGPLIVLPNKGPTTPTVQPRGLEQRF